MAERGESLLPVLASRDAEVEAARDASFPRLRTSTTRIRDARGWAAGSAAADAASIAAAKPLAG